ncbi:MAG: hydroxymethylbilane synthase, partial [Sinomonas sp.]
MSVRIGTRGSALALTQTQQTAAMLAAVGGFETELVRIKTEGDVRTGSLAQLGGTGVFVAALREALLADRCDVAIHSLKDLPTGGTP